MIFENSRYLMTRAVKRGEEGYILELRERAKFDSNKFNYHTWTEDDSLDGLAFIYYGISALRWAILDANPKYQTEFDINFGDVINIPDMDEVIGYVR